MNFLEDEDLAFVKRFILFTLSGMRCLPGIIRADFFAEPAFNPKAL